MYNSSIKFQQIQATCIEYNKYYFMRKKLHRITSYRNNQDKLIIII